MNEGGGAHARAAPSSCAVRHARPLLNGAIISFGNELDDEGGEGREDGAKAT